MPPASPRRVRELTEEEVADLRSELRSLLDETDWEIRTLNEALGFDTKSSALRNIMNDKTGKVSTTRVRYDALKKIRDENLPPGVVLVSENQPRSQKRNRKTPANSVREGRRGRPSTRKEAAPPEEDTAVRASRITLPRSSSGLVFKMGDTEFTATEIEDGTWAVTLKTHCTSLQMAALAEQALADGLKLPLTEDDAFDLISAE